MTKSLLAAAMIVESPSMQGTMLSQLENLLEKVNEQVNKLQKANEYMNNVNNIVSGHSMNFANHLDVYENAKNQIESIEYNYERLKRSINDYDIAQKLRSKHLQAKCPLIDLENLGAEDIAIPTKDTGEETEETSRAYEILEYYTDITRNDIRKIEKPLTGYALAIVMCDEMQKTKKLF